MDQLEEQPEILKRERDENTNPNKLPDSPPRVKRPNMANVMSRSYQIQHGAALSNSKIKGASCELTCIAAGESRSDVSETGFKYKRGTFKGVPSHLDPNNKSPFMSIPFDEHNSKKMDEMISKHLGFIKAHSAEEKFTGFPPLVVNMSSVLEITTFATFPEDVAPGDVVGISDLVATLSFVKSSKQDSDKNGDELGRIRPANTPYINFKATVYFKRRLSSTEFKTVVAKLPLTSDMKVENKFIDENGQLCFPQDICYPNPSPTDRTPIPMFTRLTPRDLLDIWAALYNPRPSGFGLIRNRLVLYDNPPVEELEPEDGLPVFITSIPHIMDKEDKDIIFKANDVQMKCLRGPEPLKLMTAAQYPENQSGLFTVDKPRLCTTIGLYESRPKGMEEIPQYVADIGILPVVAWEKYVSQIMRGLEAILYIKPDAAQSKELTLKGVPKSNNCTDGIKGTCVVIPNMYITLMGAALRVSASVAIEILVDAQKQRGGKKTDANLLKDRYGVKDRYCEQFLTNKNSVKHFFVNSYDGYIEDLPKDDDQEWDYFLIPAENTIDAYRVRPEVKEEIDVIKDQAFWIRNHDEDWRVKNKELVQDWCKISQVSENIGVFCAKRE